MALPTIGTVAFFASTRWSDVSRNGLDLLVWGLLLLFVDLMPISYSNEIHQTMGLPVVLAAGMVLPPYQVALVALLAAFDPREFNGQVGLGRALFNRSQVALSAGTASLVFHVLDGNPTLWPAVLWVALLALAAEVLVNWLTVMAAAVLLTGATPRQVTRDIFLDSPVGFALSYGAVGLLALLFASASEGVGNWGLAASVVPLALARHMFLLRRRSAIASNLAAEKEQLLELLSNQIAAERLDERARVAAALHDDLLPALFRVHLLGEVLREDLDSGRLLALEDDIPELRRAANDASRQIRTLIRDLRRSSIGVGGLASTLQLVIDELGEAAKGSIHAEIADVGLSPSQQLLIYQIAREALQNAVAHANATTISIRLYRDGSYVRLIVIDDGRGFVSQTVDKERHFGLQIMRERAEQAGGIVSVETRPGRGTQVTGRFPSMPE